MNAVLTGIDLTERAIEHTKTRFDAFGLQSNLSVGDAENLQFEDESFNIIYSWGVLHYTPDMRKAVLEVYRVLKKGGCAKVMIYHKWSVIGFMLWLRYGLLALRPWRGLNFLYSDYLESPGTQAFSVEQAEQIYLKLQRS